MTKEARNPNDESWRELAEESFWGGVADSSPMVMRDEARETKYFLRMIVTAQENLKSEARVLWCEAKELHLIFCKIWRS